MAVIATCKCGYARNLTDFYAGKKVRCPSCNSIVLVPVIDTVYEIGSLPDFAQTSDLAPVAHQAPDSGSKKHPGGSRQQPVADTQSAAMMADAQTHFVAPTVAASRYRKTDRQFSEVFDGRPEPKGLFEQKDSGKGCCIVGSLLVIATALVAVFHSGHPLGRLLAFTAVALSVIHIARLSGRGHTIAPGLLALLISVLAVFFTLKGRTPCQWKRSIQQRTIPTQPIERPSINRQALLPDIPD